jgi:hypothetical protein
MITQVEMTTTLGKYLNKRLVNVSYGLEEVFKKVVSFRALKMVPFEPTTQRSTCRD